MSVLVLAYQDIGYVCLEALLQAGAEVTAVFTHEDDPGEEIWFRSVAELARSRSLPVYTPEDPNHPEMAALVRSLAPDFIFSFYYRYLLSAEFLAAARRGAYNLHGSLLPRYRGRAPINWVLVNGETETGLTLHRMIPRPDAGDIAAQVRVPIAESDTIRELYAKMTAAAARLITATWPELAAGRIKEVPQDESQAGYFGRRRPEDGRIDWQAPAKKIYDLCRAVTHPYPGCFTFHQGKKLYIWSAGYDSDPETRPPGTVLGLDGEKGLAVACGQGRLYIKSAQWAGQGELAGPELVRIDLPAGARLGDN